MDKRLLAILVCPLCNGLLILKNNALICRFDRLAYPIEDGIPVMLTELAKPLSLEELDS